MEHLSTDQLFAFAAGWLRLEGFQEITTHLLTCADCCRIKSECERAFLAMLQSYLGHAHTTPQGTITIKTEQSVNGWLGRIEGSKLNGTIMATSKLGAIREAEQTFREIFPEHRCGKRCGWITARTHNMVNEFCAGGAAG